MGKLLQAAILLLLLGYGAYFLWQKRAPEHPVDLPPLTIEKVEAPKASPRISASPQRVPSQMPQFTARKETVGANPAEKPDGNVIEFHIVNGLAVAYGDVLLGKPEPGFEGDRGHYDAPVPQLWDRPEIAYAINPDLPNPKRVEAALEYLRQSTPVNFVPFQGQRDAIVFEPGDEHCLSYLGRKGGAQPIKLSAECQTPEILHEIMHALGFVHEQSRPDRDQFVQVVWENIEQKYRSQFAIVPDTFLEALKDSPFDYHSVMLYRPDSFGRKPGMVTLRSTGSEPVAPVQDGGLSPMDLQRLRRLYGR